MSGTHAFSKSGMNTLEFKYFLLSIATQLKTNSKLTYEKVENLKNLERAASRLQENLRRILGKALQPRFI